MNGSFRSYIAFPWKKILRQRVAYKRYFKESSPGTFTCKDTRKQDWLKWETTKHVIATETSAHLLRSLKVGKSLIVVLYGQRGLTFVTASTSHGCELPFGKGHSLGQGISLWLKTMFSERHSCEFSVADVSSYGSKVLAPKRRSRWSTTESLVAPLASCRLTCFFFLIKFIGVALVNGAT